MEHTHREDNSRQFAAWACTLSNDPAHCVPQKYTLASVCSKINCCAAPDLVCVQAVCKSMGVQLYPLHSSQSLKQGTNEVSQILSTACFHLLECRCPGVFSGQGCGAKLKWVQFREGGGCWGCASWPACDYKEAAVERLASPQVTLEAVSKDIFKAIV